MELKWQAGSFAALAAFREYHRSRGCVRRIHPALSPATGASPPLAGLRLDGVDAQ